MRSRRATLCLGLTAGLTLLEGGWSTTFSANPPVTLDNPPSGIVPDVSLGPGDVPQRATGRERVPSGNPLWAIPLSTLAATRERPIFRPSRRPPAPAVLGQPRVEPVMPAVAPSAPERPQLTLVGAVVGDTEGIAVFLDSNNTVIRLRTGQDYSGWVLNAVRGREATLQRDHETAVFALPVPGSDGVSLATGHPIAGSPLAAPNGALVIPSGPGDFAPFVPQSTPQDGSHDGL